MSEAPPFIMKKTFEKGFIGSILLALLNKEPSHGYKIQKTIAESTMGLWSPPDSSLYTSLKQLLKKGLIEFKEEHEGERLRKVYYITLVGKKALKKIEESKNRMKTLMLSTISIMTHEDDMGIFKSMPEIDPTAFFSSDFLQKMPVEKKIKFLSNYRNQMLTQAEFMDQMIKKIDILINELKKSIPQ